MSKTGRSPSYPQCVAAVLRRVEGPITLDALLAEIGQLRDVGSGGRSAVTRALRGLYQAVPVGDDRYGWLSTLLNSVYLRHPLTDIEVRRGFLMLDELEHAAFFPEFFQKHLPLQRAVTLRLMDGPVIEAEAYVERRTWSLKLGPDFVHWVERLGGTGQDNIIIYVENAARGEYTLRLQPHEARIAREIEQRNVALALTAEAVIAASGGTDEHMATWDLAARLVGRGLYHEPVPPDELHYVLHHYSSLAYLEGVGYAVDHPLADSGIRQGPSAEVAHDLNGTEPPVESVLQLMGWTDEQAATESLHDWLDLFAHNGDLSDVEEDGADPGDEEYCNAYLRYLDRVDGADDAVTALSHNDFHLIAAELEYMMALEDEFDTLLPDQEERKRQLAERLLLDPETLSNDDLDIPDYPDYDEPPFWDN